MDIKEKITSTLGGKKFFFILFMTLLFIAIGLYVYKNHIKKKINKDFVENKEFIDSEDADSGANSNRGNKYAELYFFYTSWCPHCKVDKPVWDKFKKSISPDGINGVKINFIDVDCDDDPGVAEKYEVDAYPTIKLVYDGKVIEYDAKTEIDTLNEFLKSSL